MRVINEGLLPNDRVIMAGIQRARPGATVEPEQVDMASFTASALRAATEAEKAALSPSEAKTAEQDGQP